MHRLIESSAAQFTGYGIASLTSAVILSIQQQGVIDPSGILQVIPQWAIVTSWVLSSIMALVTMGASAYKKIMEGKAQVLLAEKEVCIKDDCAYREFYFDNRRRKGEDE
jgi:hypothetical protein